MINEEFRTVYFSVLPEQKEFITSTLDELGFSLYMNITSPRDDAITIDPKHKEYWWWERIQFVSFHRDIHPLVDREHLLRELVEVSLL